MLKSEKTNIDGIDLMHVYSDNPDKKILQNETGQVYGDVYDSLNSNYTYTEVDNNIIIEEESN